MTLLTQISASTDTVPQASISVLMATYQGERADYLDQALASIQAQTLLPDQIVVVLDGPVGQDQREVLAHHAAGPVDLTLVELEKNGGLAEALNAGLEHCRNDIVARMDSDDYAAPHRLEVQWARFNAEPAVDVLAATQGEFLGDPSEITAVKNCPLTHDKILRLLKWRNPICHPSVMYRRSLVLNFGGYSTKYPLLEDYELWLRLAASGAKFAATEDPLLMVRVLPEQRVRRGGWAYFMTEARFRADCLSQRHFGLGTFLASLAIYAVFRLSTPRMRAFFYHLVRKKAS